MLLELLKIIDLMALGQGLLVVLLLLIARDGLRAANTTLAAFVAVLALYLWNSYVGLLGSYYEHWRQPQLVYVLSWLWGPLLYLYTRQLCDGRAANSGLWLTHGLATPAFGLALNWTLAATGLAPETVILGCTMVLYTQLLLYLYESIRYINSHRQHIQSHYANLERVNLTWLLRLLWGFTGLIVIDAIIFTISRLQPDSELWVRHWLTFSECLYAFAIGLFALRQPEIVHTGNGADSAVKHQRSSLNEAAAQRLLTKLDTLMADQTPYLDNQLTLTRLSEQLHVSAYHLSQCLNEYRQQRFYDFINRARITHAQRLLQDEAYQAQGGLEIAFAVGFNTKASFNRAFKQYTGVTPSIFRTKSSPLS